MIYCWLLQNKRGAKIYWEHTPDGPPAMEQAAKILGTPSVPKGNTVGHVDPAPALRSVGKINGIECFVESAL